MTTNKTLYVVSGIGLDDSGTGRLIRHIAASSEEASASGWNLVILTQYRHSLPIRPTLKKREWRAAANELFKRSANIPFRAKLWWLGRVRTVPMLFFHMQSFGTKRAWKILSGWRGQVHLYVLDAGVYCIRSYNHLVGKTQPCTDCIGRNFSAITRNKCDPFPLPDPFFSTFVERLPSLADKKGLRLLTQSESQTQLLSGHFPPERVKTVGLWTIDWNDLIVSSSEPEANEKESYDVVFHGFSVAAKGVDWLFEVARHAPSVNFLFACSRNPRLEGELPNVTFKPMTWETGLRAAISSAPLTFVPSLWSASIEGALLKTIVTAPRTGVVRTETAYQSEIPEDIVSKFDQEPEKAAEQLKQVLSQPRTDTQTKRLWWEAFQSRNRGLIGNILDTIEE